MIITPHFNVGVKYRLEPTMLLSRLNSTIRSPDRVKRISDYIIAQILYRVPKKTRQRLFYGEQYSCPICSSKLRTFLALQRPYHAWCPVCRSLQRHRLVWLYLKRQTNLFDQSPKKMLHFAPEPALMGSFHDLPYIDYLSADLYDSNAMVKMDINDIQYPDGSFDVIYCSHVLEHVPDDRLAMRELRRVLNQSGWAVIVVPIVSDATIEDPSLTDPLERERRFGQVDHVRVYGPDVQERLEGAGFHLAKISTLDVVNDDEVVYYGLDKNETIFLCR